jgi:hypothetical protein
MSKVENNSLGLSSIDSFKYRIPIHLVKILNNNILDNLINVKTNAETGEILEETSIQANSLKIQREGYQIHFGIQKLPDTKYLVVIINSYLLEHKYLEGITMKNIELVYNNLMKCEVFEISFEDFLEKGILSDIDIKKDLELEKDEFIKGIKQLENHSIARKKTGLGVNVFNKANNIGIEWNSREKATAKTPFLKVYHKQTQSVCKDAELESKGQMPFFDTYVNHKQLENVIRIESTIKNLKSARKHGIEKLSLRQVLKLTPDYLNDILTTAINLNVESRMPETKKPKSKSDLSPSELIYYIHLDNMIRVQMFNFETALEYTLEYFTDKVTKARMKKKLTDIYNQHIEQKSYVKKTKRMNKFFDSLGWR